MKLETGNFCPLVQGPCKKLECTWFTQIRGTNPNSGEPVDEWGCAVTWLPVLLIENSQMQRQTGAAVESLRNESVKRADVTNKILLGSNISFPPALLQAQDISNSNS
jgi:hypothetical protein